MLIVLQLKTNKKTILAASLMILLLMNLIAILTGKIIDLCLYKNLIDNICIITFIIYGISALAEGFKSKEKTFINEVTEAENQKIKIMSESSQVEKKSHEIKSREKINEEYNTWMKRKSQYPELQKIGKSGIKINPFASEDDNEPRIELCPGLSYIPEDSMQAEESVRVPEKKRFKFDKNKVNNILDDDDIFGKNDNVVLNHKHSIYSKPSNTSNKMKRISTVAEALENEEGDASVRNKISRSKGQISKGNSLFNVEKEENAEGEEEENEEISEKNEGKSEEGEEEEKEEKEKEEEKGEKGEEREIKESTNTEDRAVDNPSKIDKTTNDFILNTKETKQAEKQQNKSKVVSNPLNPITFKFKSNLKETSKEPNSPSPEKSSAVSKKFFDINTTVDQSNNGGEYTLMVDNNELNHKQSGNQLINAEESSPEYPENTDFLYKTQSSEIDLEVFWAIASTMALSECGDKTQMSSFFMSAVYNLTGVIIGTTCALIVSTCTAVFIGRFIIKKVSERVINFILGLVILNIALKIYVQKKYFINII